MTLRSRLVARSWGLPPATTPDVMIEKEIRIPMRDGVELLADRYYARSAPTNPVVLIRSPYGRFSGFAMTARLFAERGFQVLLQSCRGTFGSGGTFDPMHQEPDDGMDTLDWLQAQPWCQGKVHTFGMSYLGMVQWAIAAPAADRLAGMTLHFTLSNYRNEALSFDGLALEGVLGWATMMAKLTQAKSAFGLVKVMFHKIRTEVYDTLPLRDLDRAVVGRKVQWWQNWMEHGDPTDPWWNKIDHTRTIPHIQAPANMVAGWQDLFLPWQVKDFEAMRAAGKEAWLTIGPWHHTSREGGAEAMRQGLAFHTALSGGKLPFPDRKRVRIYVRGAEEWREYDQWPPEDSRQVRLNLHGDGRLCEAVADEKAAPSRFSFDPADPTPSLHMPSPFRGGKTRPCMAALEARADTLVFSGAPFSADCDVVGPVVAHIHMRSTSQHSDLYACLCDVDPAGTPLKVCDGYLRLRLDKHPPDTEGIRSAAVEFWPTAYRFRKGHTMRLIVAGGAHPHWARNLGTGEPLSDGTGMMSQDIEIFHDAARPSALRVLITRS